MKIKSITAIQVPGKGWTVRVRTAEGQEFCDPPNAPYTLAQAQAAIGNSRIRPGQVFTLNADGSFL